MNVVREIESINNKELALGIFGGGCVSHVP
jgi:hypothetical protein